MTSKNIKGIALNHSFDLTFFSVICIIPDKLLPSRACFRLYRRCKNKIKLLTFKKSTKKQH